MTDELLHGAATVRAHVQETWAPIVIDDRTLADWAKLPTNETHHPEDDDEQESHS